MKKLILFLVVLNLITFGQTAEDYVKTGFSKFNIKDYTGAIVDLNKAIQLKPDHDDAYFNRAFAKDNLKDYTGAIVDLNKVIQLKPDYAMAYNNRGYAKNYLKDMNGACKDWTKAGELGNSDALTNIQKFCIQDVKIGKQDVRIGNQVWTRTNLNVSTYRNGEVIPQVQDANAWEKLTTGAWCYYENKTANGTKYGKLYNWYAVKDPRGLAPKGYHIPTDEEWTILSDYLGGEGEAGTKMKSTSGWKDNGNGNNTSGFAGLPGFYRYSFGLFDPSRIQDLGLWWSSSVNAYDIDIPISRLLCSRNFIERNFQNKREGLSVRCIKN